MSGQSLNGTWGIVTEADEKIIPFSDDLHWQGIQVPSHWQVAGLPNYQGTVWYKKEFATPQRLAGKRYFLRFGAVDYWSEAWLNGVYLGVHEGDFDPFEYEVTGLLTENNRLIVKVTSDLDENPERKSVVKGGLYHWDCLPIRQAAIPDFPDVPSSCNPQYPNPVINPGGIWRDVEIVERDHAYIRSVKVVPQLKNGDAIIHVEAALDNVSRYAEPILRIRVEPHNFTVATNHDAESSGTAGASPDAERVLHQATGSPTRWGQSTQSLTLSIENPRLWWSHDLGEQHLYRCTVELVDENTDEVFSTITRIFGIREVRQTADWTFYLNGKRLFMRGTNYLSDQFLSQVDAGTYERDIQLMQGANMNMIRVFAHMEREEFYQLCDERGLLVFQDLPFQWGYQSDAAFIQRAEQVVERYVDRLQHHACIALWCCHSESRLYDYNKLDQILLTLVRRLDPTRPVQRNSVLADTGDLPRSFRDIPTYGDYIPPHLTGHWVGWYWGELHDKEHYNPLFVSEYGTQSVPSRASLEKFIPADALWPPDWDVWRKHGFQTQIFEKNLGPFPEHLEDLIRITQEYQARFYKEHTETLRRKKWRDVKGILTFHFVNCWPAIDWSLLDYYRVPKLAYQVVQRAFSPLLLCFKGDIENGKATVEPWVVNDYHHPYADVTLTYQVTTEAGDVLYQKTLTDLSLPSDAAERLHEITLDLPAGTERVVVTGQLLTHDGEMLMENDALLYPLSPRHGIETAADAKVGL